MNRRAQIALTPEEQRDYLAGGRTIILVSNGRHGFPLPVPMWYLVETDGAVAMTTFRKSQKSLDLRRDPRCTLLVESGRTYPELKGLIIRGRAEIDDDTGTISRLDPRLAERVAQPDRTLLARAARAGGLRI